MRNEDNKENNSVRSHRLIPSEAIKKFFNSLGLEITRKRNVPLFTLLGLKNTPIRTIIDIGANRGQFARYISTIFPAAKIFCFEPLPGPYAELQHWAEIQGGRVVAINAALGAESREVVMTLHDDHITSSSILNTTELTRELYPQTRKQREIQVQQRTLDEMLHPEDLESHVLIKMDVQGYEDRVIAGGRYVFSQSHACITEVSLDTLYQGQATFSGLSSELTKLGYRYAGNIDQKYGPDGHCVYLDAMFVRNAPL